MNETDAMVPAGSGELPCSRYVDCIGLIGIGLSLSNPPTAQIHHAVGPEVRQSFSSMRACYIKLKSGRTVFFRDIGMEGRDDYKGIVRA
jgi:hypothetical protein